MNSFQKSLLGYFVLLAIYCLILNQSGLQTDFWNYLYSFSFSLIPLVVGFFGLSISQRWGCFTSAIGRAIFYISAGSMCWGFGSMVWSFYNFFLHDSAPYPSLADLGFVLAIPLWIIGAINLSKATGAKFGLRKLKGKFLLISIPVVIALISYYLLVVIARGGEFVLSMDSYLKLFLDLAYPLSDVVILTVVLIIFGLSINYFGGQYKIAVLSLMIGFVSMYLADFVFSYTTTVGTFYNGNFGDFLFTIAFVFIAFGVLGFYRKVDTKPAEIES